MRACKFPRQGLGIAFNDFDRDGWPDIFIANDKFPQQLFQNNGDGTFKEMGLPAGVSYDGKGAYFPAWAWISRTTITTVGLTSL